MPTLGRTDMPHACCCYRLLFRCGDPSQLTRVRRCAGPCLLTDMPYASNQTIKLFAPQIIRLMIPTNSNVERFTVACLIIAQHATGARSP
jgi:hypothetical protein